MPRYPYSQERLGQISALLGTWGQSCHFGDHPRSLGTVGTYECHMTCMGYFLSQHVQLQLSLQIINCTAAILLRCTAIRLYTCLYVPRASNRTDSSVLVLILEAKYTEIKYSNVTNSTENCTDLGYWRLEALCTQVHDQKWNWRHMRTQSEKWAGVGTTNINPWHASNQQNIIRILYLL